MSLLLMSPEPAMEISRSMQEMLFPLMSPEPATEILRFVRLQSHFSVPRLPNLPSAMPFNFSAVHTYFQFIVGYADILLEADVESIVLDTDIQ